MTAEASSKDAAAMQVLHNASLKDAMPTHKFGGRPAGLLLPFVAVTCFLAVSFAQYVFFDIPSSIGQYLIDDIGIRESQYGFITAIYSVPNIILPLFAGLLCDNFGRARSYILYYSLVVLGSFVFNLGAAYPASANSWTAFIVMVLGRGIFALGGDNGLVANDVIISMIMPKRFITFSLTISILVGRLGSFFAMNTIPFAVSRLGLTAVMYGTMPLLVPFTLAYLTAGIVGYITIKRRKLILKATTVKPDVEEFPTAEADVRPATTPLYARVGALFRVPSVGILLALLILPSAGIVGFGWTSVGQVVLVARCGLSPTAASRLVSVTELIAMVSPLWGFLIDRLRGQLLLMIISALCSITAFAMLIITPRWPLIPMIMQGLAFSIVTPSCWSSVPLCLPKAKIGITLGLLTCSLNLGMALTGFIGPTLLNIDPRVTLLWFLGAGVLTLIVTAVFIVYDIFGNKGRLIWNRWSGLDVEDAVVIENKLYATANQS
ncbi:Major facilitator superfamily [Carpediemonas membranifera]|uniref:Lysosomal dipeptide transporter MFSD1 n=1 Tax=Carpediemonas membranifera TaxID=201153 RepID=A0A8J6BAK2_9EUKA|nr:Major facilitator superfamily [Carpediemonas membranifera]|eukprot:KAG9393372.1 Major facilitator superfamily [Carpediemonas membranifera]